MKSPALISYLNRCGLEVIQRGELHCLVRSKTSKPRHPKDGRLDTAVRHMDQPIHAGRRTFHGESQNHHEN